MADGSTMSIVKIEKPRSQYMILEKRKEAKNKLNPVIFLNSKDAFKIVMF